MQERWRIDDKTLGSPCVRAVYGNRRRTIYRLRYELYTVQQAKRYASLGDDNEIEDPVDNVSLNLATYIDGKIEYALRLSWWNDVGPLDYLQCLGPSIPPNIDPALLIMCSRLVSGNRKDIRTLIALLRAAYACGLSSGGRWSMLSTRPELTALFGRLGYDRLGASLDYEYGGHQQVMLLDMRNRQYLSKLRSPLLSVLDQYLEKSCLEMM